MTKAEEYAYFKKRCLYYRDKYKVVGWHFYFSKDKLVDSRARNYINLTGRCMTFTFDTSCDWKSKQDISEVARHEVIHGLIGRVSVLAEARFVTKDETTEAVEAATNHLGELLPR